MPIQTKGREARNPVTVKFRKTTLPNSLDRFYLKPQHKKTLGIKDIAQKSQNYDLGVSAKTIEDGLNAGEKLIMYLMAEGYKVRTNLGLMHLAVKGSWEGSETSLSQGVKPLPRITPTKELRDYRAGMVEFSFEGHDKSEGEILSLYDAATGLKNEVLSPGHNIIVGGTGLKIEGSDEAGLYFETSRGLIKAPELTCNEPKRLVALAPAELPQGESCRILVKTWSSGRGGGLLLKTMRTIYSPASYNIQV
jgi:hypothetical protein